MVQVTLSSESPELLPSRGKTTKLTVLVDTLADPVDPWVIADGIVCGINKDDLKVFVSRILQYAFSVRLRCKKDIKVCSITVFAIQVL